jgi:uncharacterized protein (TIGR02246 family)
MRAMADFVAFEGTHLKGRQEIALFHQRIFDTVVKGSRLAGEVKFVRLLSPVLAVMHSGVGVTLRGQSEASPSRDSMQLSRQGRHSVSFHEQHLGVLCGLGARLLPSAAI